MELRQLTTDHERQVFGECLLKARTTSGLAFRETAQSRLAFLRQLHDRDEALHRYTQQFTSVFESMVRRYPE